MRVQELKNIFAQIFLLAMKQIIAVMTIYKYLKRKDYLLDPRGSLSLAITPQIVSVNKEVAKELATVAEWQSSSFAFFLQQVSVMLHCWCYS